MSERIKKALMGIAALAALALGGGAIAQAGGSGGGDEGEHGHQGESVTGPQADRAEKAALDATNGGEVNAVERDGENGATWEVEVTKPGGETVDVRLDQAYAPIVVEGDTEDGDE